jgi:hypothetical protein
MVVGRITAAWGLLSALVLPTLVIGAMTALISTAPTPSVVPLTCGITWTRIGGVTWFMPDCPSQSRPAPSAPNHPPPSPAAATGTPTTP